ncbi:endonuclease YncB(thermonuclease family) [Varunaivibrio sulfuroxidans]|uniref:Endonuclease YncB(Thermonuclease family) n=2 Tax=Varunaivibrio sulfuroxidans TaxID=1773489 RepID=A0A4R3JEW2_9PROT|nr:endonuclease YncB(thermonuclease family) [Varunaivibrio sulfuroxidans]
MARWLRKGVFPAAIVAAQLFLLTRNAAWAGDGFLPRGLTAGHGGRVVAVVDGDTLRLDDGRTVRLAGIQAPQLPGVRDGGPRGRARAPRGDVAPWPLADAAKKALAALAQGKFFALYFAGRRRDRYGHLLAQVVGRDGVWLQGRMLALGLARVYPFADNRTVTKTLYARERVARAARRGIWAQAFYAPRRPDTAQADIGSFQVVEGRVRAVAVVRGTAYLNFGVNWRNDFTVKIPKKALKKYHDVHGDPLTLKDRTVRVRGWIGSENGPMIVLTHPEALEVVGVGPHEETKANKKETDKGR